MTEKLVAPAGNLKPVRPKKRKPGAQPGNQNARKHGFYAKFLTPEEQQGLQKVARLKGLKQEIALMRIKIASLLANAPGNYEVFVQAVSTLARLLRTMKSLDELQTGAKNKSLLG